jgi:hypothetical protein
VSRAEGTSHGCDTPINTQNNYGGPVTAYPCAPCGPWSSVAANIAAYPQLGNPMPGGLQLDCFHPNMVLDWRPPLNAGEQYWLAP